jgi:hypothetical protein
VPVRDQGPRHLGHQAAPQAPAPISGEQIDRLDLAREPVRDQLGRALRPAGAEADQAPIRPQRHEHGGTRHAQDRAPLQGRFLDREGAQQARRQQPGIGIAPRRDMHRGDRGRIARQSSSDRHVTHPAHARHDPNLVRSQKPC